MTGFDTLQTMGRKKANIQIIPLIDVVFFLLATFVLFTLSLNKIFSVPAPLPQAGDGPTIPPLILQVTDAGIYWDKELITERELPERLAIFLKNTENPRVMLAGDDKASFGRTVAVLDEVRKAGVTQLSFETAWRGSGR